MNTDPKISRAQFRLSQNRFCGNSISREESQKGGKDIAQVERHSSWEMRNARTAQGRQSLAEVESSTIVASNLLLDRESDSAYSRQSDFGRGHFDRRVNFNDSDLLEPADRLIWFLVFDCRQSFDIILKQLKVQIQRNFVIKRKYRFVFSDTALF